MHGIYGKLFMERFLYICSKRPAMEIGSEKVKDLHTYLRGYYDAIELVYEKDLVKGMTFYLPFSSYCKSVIGVEISEFADYVINKHPKDEKAAFREYLQHIEDYLHNYLRTREIIHKFRRSYSKSAFIRKVKKWINDNPSACVEHLMLKEEITEPGKTASYKGYVFEHRLNQKIKEEYDILQETKRILGHKI